MRIYIIIIQLIFLLTFINGCKKEELVLDLLITPTENIEANGKTRIKLETSLKADTKFSGEFWFSTQAGLFSNQMDTIVEMAIDNKATTFLTVGQVEGDFDVEVCFKNKVGQVCEEQIIQLTPNSAFKDYNLDLNHQGSDNLVADNQSMIEVQISSNADHANEEFIVVASEGVFLQNNKDSLIGRLNNVGGFSASLKVSNTPGSYFISFIQKNNKVSISEFIEVGYSLPTTATIVSVSSIPKTVKTVNIQLILQRDFGEISKDIQFMPTVNLIEAGDTLSNIGFFFPTFYRTREVENATPINFDITIQDSLKFSKSTGKLEVAFQYCYKQTCEEIEPKLIEIN